MNALDNLSVYDLAEQFEAEGIRAHIKSCWYQTLKSSWRYDVKHPGNVRRLLKAGYKVYSSRHDCKDLLITLPDFDITTTKAGAFAPVLLENNQLVGL